MPAYLPVPSLRRRTSRRQAAQGRRARRSQGVVREHDGAPAARRARFQPPATSWLSPHLRNTSFPRTLSPRRV